MANNLDPVIDFRAWELVQHVGNPSCGERIVTAFVSKITKLETYRLSEEGDGKRVYAVCIDCLQNYFITPETYDFIKERMHKGTPIKIEEVVCVERV